MAHSWFCNIVQAVIKLRETRGVLSACVYKGANWYSMKEWEHENVTETYIEDNNVEQNAPL